MFLSRIIAQVRSQIGGRVLDPRFVEHVAVTTLNFDDVKFTGYDLAPTELPVKIPADCTEAPSDEHDLPIL